MTGHLPPEDSAPGLPLAEAARALGLSEEALRMRLRRGRVDGYKGEDGRLYIRVPGATPPAAPAEPAPAAVALMTEEIADLRRRLDEAERAQAEMRRLLLQAQQNLVELTHAVSDRHLLTEASRAPAAPPPWAMMLWPWLAMTGGWPPKTGG